MHVRRLTLISLLSATLGFSATLQAGPVAESQAFFTRMGADLKEDAHQYFQKESLFKFSDAFVTSAVFANSGLDSSVRKQWRENIKSRQSDHFFSPFQKMGSLRWLSFPVYLASYGLGQAMDNHRSGPILTQWSARSMRAVVLGGIQQVTLTGLLGSGRPCNNVSSKWQPFRHNTGVSGHAFYGAIPFLTAARMSEPAWLRYSLYGVSTLSGLSRINSDAHYFSQVLLGWTLAYISTEAVYNTESLRQEGGQSAFRLSMLPSKKGVTLVAKLVY